MEPVCFVSEELVAPQTPCLFIPCILGNCVTRDLRHIPDS